MDFKKVKNEKGITLIALAVTIIVLLILAGVSLNAVFSQNGIISKAQDAQEKMNAAEENDLTSINNLNQEMENWINGTNEKDEEEVISKQESFVGYFADIDGDGTVDGVIYADLAVGGSGTWSSSNSSTYSYNAVEDKSTLKNYVISQESYTVEGATGYGTKPVLKANGTGGTKDRFYVMALSDVTNSGTSSSVYFTWYDAAYDSGISEYASITSTAFGAGKNNTTVMINSWNGTAYGAQNDRSGYLDMWGVIQDECSGKWFVPSKEEWCAFAENLEITSGNYGNFGLSDWYWSSSLDRSLSAWEESFNYGCVSSSSLNYHSYVRLSATF